MDTNITQLLFQLAQQKQSPAVSNNLIVIVAALAPTLAALAAYIKAKSVETGVKEVHLAINSRLDGWLKRERTQGEEDGREQERKATRPKTKTKS